MMKSLVSQPYRPTMTVGVMVLTSRPMSSDEVALKDMVSLFSAKEALSMLTLIISEIFLPSAVKIALLYPVWILLKAGAVLPSPWQEVQSVLSRSIFPWIASGRMVFRANLVVS